MSRYLFAQDSVGDRFTVVHQVLGCVIGPYVGTDIRKLTRPKRVSDRGPQPESVASGNPNRLDVVNEPGPPVIDFD